MNNTWKETRIERWERYRKEVRRSIGEPFDWEDFFQDREEKDYGASVIITPNQAITIANVENYRGYHPYTQSAVVGEIYNLPVELMCTYKSGALEDKNICMDLRNDKGIKQIMVFFPAKITEGHLDLLRAYQNTYGETVKKISIQYENEDENNSPIVVCASEDGKSDVYCHSFEEAIRYAESLPRVETQDTSNEIILGQVISSDGLTLCDASALKSLCGHNEEALAKGVTWEDCEDSLKYIRREKLWGDQ